MKPKTLPSTDLPKDRENLLNAISELLVQYERGPERGNNDVGATITFFDSTSFVYDGEKMDEFPDKDSCSRCGTKLS